MQTSNDNVKKDDGLVASLHTAREQVTRNNDNSRELAEQFENLLADVNK